MTVEMKSGDKLEYYTDSKGEHRWRFTASNGEIIGAASEGYSSKQGAEANWERDRSKDKCEVYQDKAGEWRWRAFATNGQQTGRATEGYSSKASCMSNLERNGYNTANVEEAKAA
jgi:uncharacterized protein YegP (UPF0339 family)